jgi:diguanylate cyclase (GGDEF)-like protein
MPSAPTPPTERRRLAAVQKLRLLGTPAEERFDKITRLARRLFDVPIAIIDLVGKTRVWLKAVEGLDRLEVDRPVSYCQYTILRDEVCYIEDALHDQRVFDSPYAPGLRFYAGRPLRYDGENVGVLCICDTMPRTMTLDSLGALKDLAEMAEHELHVTRLTESQLKLAQEAETLEQKALVDLLTRVWNRAAITEILSREVEAARALRPSMPPPAQQAHDFGPNPDATGDLPAPLARPSDLPRSVGGALSVVMLDIDHFKKVNDTHGHPGGDQVLREVSSCLRFHVRPFDAVGRYGGEEFVLILPGATLPGAAIAAERIRSAIEQREITHDGKSVPVTSSFGVAELQGVETPEDLIKRADVALYLAKRNGRNRVHATQ